MARCGTEEACNGCPIISNINQSEYGVFNYRYADAERLGEAAEKLHQSGWRDISDESAWAVATSAVDRLENAPERLRQAIQRMGTSACEAVKIND